MNEFEEGDILVPIKQPTNLKVKVVKCGNTLFRGEVIQEGDYETHNYPLGQSDLWLMDGFKLSNDNQFLKFKKGDIIRATTLEDAECLLIVGLSNSRTHLTATVLYSDLNGVEPGDILNNCDQARYQLVNVDLVFKLKGNGNS